jgi:formylglycine-generating enzyme
VEGEVLFLHTPISKAISVATFLGLTLGAGEPPPSRESPAHPVSAGYDGVTAKEASSKAKSVEPAGLPGKPGSCAAGMVLVDGDYCPDADQVCLKWLDPPPYQNLRCGEFSKPAKCKGQRQHRRYCVDRDEYAESTTGDPKDALPIVNKSWTEAKSLCEARGARLCKESEWEFACEGPEMNPYPYGFKRDSSMCNHDRTDLGGPMDKLRDHRAALGAFPQCTSAFGAHDMIGNVDEWVEREGAAAPYRSALRGGWWLPGRNRCRAATLHHDESYSAKQVGFRCCADAK